MLFDLRFCEPESPCSRFLLPVFHSLALVLPSRSLLFYEPRLTGHLLRSPQLVAQFVGMRPCLQRYDSFSVLDAFIEGGGNCIDTADVYGQGASESILGR